MKTLIAFSLLISMSIGSLYAEGLAHEQKIERIKDIVEKDGWYQGCKTIGRELQELEPISAKSPKWEDSIFVKAGCLSETRRDHEAIAILKEALKIKPGNGLLLDMLGTSYVRIGQNEDAITTLTEALIYREGGSIHSKLATSYMRKGAVLQGVNNNSERNRLLDLAEKHVKRAMELDNLPNSPIRYSELAHVKLAKGEYQEAISLFEHAIILISYNRYWDERMISTAHAEYNMAMGQAYYLSGDTENGVHYMSLAKEKAPTEELKYVMASIMDSTINMEKSVNDLKNKKPELVLPSFIPLDE